MATTTMIALAVMIGLASASYYDRAGAGSTRPRGGDYYPGTGDVIGITPKWGSWGPWGACSKTCQGGYQTRTRECKHPTYRLYLFGQTDCYGSSTETRPCNEHIYCKVDGGWTHWSVYGTCSASCGKGTKTRTRSCTNPAPSHNGAYCVGHATETVDCYGDSQYCPVDGKWTHWTEYGACSASCGKGTKTRTRSCTDPAPLYGGADCYGEDTQDMDCYGDSQYCPVDGKWTPWTEYGACSASCGKGSKTRTRYCTNPAPLYGGADCVGDATQSMDCYGDSQYCPVHGGWSDYGVWSACSVQCGHGYQYRYRSCTNPRPLHGGNDCYGSAQQKKKCHGDNCGGSYYK